MKAPAPPYRQRRTWIVDQRRHRGWEIKIYAITASGGDLSEGILEAGWSHAGEYLPAPPEGWPAQGFLILHEGTEGVWLLLDLWVADILHHRLFRAPLETPGDFAAPPSESVAACVWELAVIQHERDAWVRHVLAHPEAPDRRAYFGDQLRIGAPPPG